MELRDYQKKAVDVLWEDLPKERFVLLEAATGSGKTVMFAELIRRYMVRYPKMRILVVAHRQELVLQAFRKLVRVWPDGVEKIGLACNGAGPIDISKAVTIGSVQTLVRRNFDSDFRLVIADECHHIPHMEAGGSFRKLLDKLEAANPDVRILGVTATPFRLGHGYVYGDKCLPGRTNHFPRLNHRIGMDELTKKGFLVPVRAKEAAAMRENLDKIALVRGDYDLNELSGLYEKEYNLKLAVEAYERLGEGRKNALVFAVSIEHANKLRDAFLAAGHPAGSLSSLNSNEERVKALADFDDGGTNVLVNVGILTEGWDNPKVDLILMCRPTKAPALFAQMVGRGTRTMEGKKDVLILDLAENFKTHGRPEFPRVVSDRKRKRRVSSDYVTCPGCREYVRTPAETCPVCGHRFGGVRRGKPAVVREAGNPKEDAGATADAADRAKVTPAPETGPEKETIPATPAEKKERVKFFRVMRTTSKRGNLLAVVLVFLESGEYVSHWVDIEGNCSPGGRWRAEKFWRELSGGLDAPESVNDAIARANELRIPGEVTIVWKNGFKRVKELDLF
ncbi:MAG: DEAD/DEAH box helicase [Deltaproteobacteria bacterium]|jgi:DNA repair protein RadD|nr:DEAD/DEAH box helicase [Deltaproteobacteria bacterium]